MVFTRNKAPDDALMQIMSSCHWCFGPQSLCLFCLLLAFHPLLYLEHVLSILLQTAWTKEGRIIHSKVRFLISSPRIPAYSSIPKKFLSLKRSKNLPSLVLGKLKMSILSLLGDNRGNHEGWAESLFTTSDGNRVKMRAPSKNRIHPLLAVKVKGHSQHFRGKFGVVRSARPDRR